MDKKISIRLFNAFEIRMNGKPILESLCNTRKTKLFLSYLVLHKERAVSHKELFELLWSGEDYSNPGTALRTLLYRYRSLIERSGYPQLSDSILSKRGSYQWNPELDISIDIFDFEDYSRIGLNQVLSKEKRIECLEKAIDLYTGSLLADSATEHWVVPKEAHYREVYILDVLAYAGMLEEAGDYGKASKLIDRAIELAGDDDLLLLEKKFADSKGKLPKAEKLTYEKLHAYADEMAKEIVTVQRNMEADDSDNTAFVCDYDMFKDIYHLQRRLLARTGETMFLTLLTMGTSDKNEFDTLRNENIMRALMESSRHTLRCGDSICRYSDSQLAIMFPADSYDNAKKIMDRVRKAFMTHFGDETMLLSYRIRPLKNVKD